MKAKKLICAYQRYISCLVPFTQIYGNDCRLTNTNQWFVKTSDVRWRVKSKAKRKYFSGFLLADGDWDLSLGLVTKNQTYKYLDLLYNNGGQYKKRNCLTSSMAEN